MYEVQSNVDQVREAILSCSGVACDVVVVSRESFPELGRLKVRYLNYIKGGDRVRFALEHPEELISATLECVGL